MSALPLSEAEQIRQEMVRVRSELHNDVDEVVASARALTDWRQYVRSYPWVCLGVAAAAGYLIVPSRRKPPAAPPKTSAAQTQQAAVESGVKAGAAAGVLGTVVSTIGTFALRSAMNFASRKATEWLDARMSPASAHTVGQSAGEPAGAAQPRIYAGPAGGGSAHVDV